MAKSSNSDLSRMFNVGAPAVRKTGSAMCEEICNVHEARRYELGVEAICRLTVDVLGLSMKYQGAQAPARLCQRYWGISYAASAKPVLEEVPTATMSIVVLLWQCLNRATELTRVLISVHSKDQWQYVQELIVAWQDAWGDDARANYAEARFTTLTGIVRGAKEARDAYMHAALIRALSDIQA